MTRPRACPRPAPKSGARAATRSGGGGAGPAASPSCSRSSFVVFVGASLAAAAYTERSSFCETACHEMAPYGATWEKSAHHDVACVRCHIKPGALEFVEAKGSALREV